MALSSRAEPFLASNPKSYGSIHVSLLGDLYDETSNPDGAILMSVAENKLCGDIILERLQEHKPFTQAMLNYTDGTGLPTFKPVLAEFMTRDVLKLGDNQAVKPEQLVVSAGCTGLLFQLSTLLFERGDSILIPTPYYPAFEQDFGFLGGVHLISVDPTNAQYDLALEDLNRAYILAVERKQPPKAVLIANPHNPLGKIYSPEQLLMLVGWCREHKIHLISDEIYALSVFNPAVDGAFHSLAALLDNDLGEYVHILWGVSKDLGSSGLRVGALYSHNQALVRAIGANNTAHQVSNAIQELFADMLQDATFMRYLIAENNARIQKNYLLLTQGLDALGLTYIPAGAGIFLFVNLQPLMREVSYEAERELHWALVEKIKWSLTPGEPCKHTTPGYFRVCYCWVSPAGVVEAMKRLKSFKESLHFN